MKSTTSLRVLLPVLLWLFTACTPARPNTAPTLPAPTAAPTRVATVVPTVEPTPTPVSTATAIPTPTAAPLSFAAATYQDDAAGFAFDYPADWTLDPSSQVGVRGGQALLLSPGTTVETLAADGTRVAIIVYRWDPKNDIQAYVAQRKLAWDASGFAIVQEEQWQLADGRVAYNFTVMTPDAPAFFLLTTVGEDYLQIGGDGDIALIEEIARTLRPLNSEP